MATFILVNPEREASSIAMLVNFRGKKYRKSIGESVRVKQWSSTKKRVKVTAGNTEATLVNEKLDLWEEAARKAVAYFKEKTYVPESDEFIEVLSGFRFGKQETSHMSVIDYFDIYIERYSGIRTPNRIKQYKLTKNVLSRYCRERKTVLYFEKLDMSFYHSFLEWFYGQGYSENYFGSVIKVLKGMCNEAKEVDHIQICPDIEGKNFKGTQKAADTIYLTVDELMKIHRLDISDFLIASSYPDLPANKVAPRARAYRKARDLFLIGAFTGLRVSDFSRLSDRNISENITVWTKKTGTKVVIPMHPVVREIIDSGYDFSKAMPEQKLNKYIKEVARLAGIDEPVTVNRNIGGRNFEEAHRKYELITTHTARRSFATNAYKAGVPTIAIMKITGHTRETTFLSYIKVSEEENAEMLANHPFFK